MYPRCPDLRHYEIVLPGTEPSPAPSSASRGRNKLDTSLAHAKVYLQVPRKDAVETTGITGDELLRVLATLANPHRLQVVAALAKERTYVSQLARQLGISRALLQVHLRKLEAAGLVTSTIEVSEDGKAMKFYEVTPFALPLTPATIMVAASTLAAETDVEVDAQ
jgi:DNA-binding transcriptional ArsR family regulator